MPTKANKTKYTCEVCGRKTKTPVQDEKIKYSCGQTLPPIITYTCSLKCSREWEITNRTRDTLANIDKLSGRIDLAKDCIAEAIADKKQIPKAMISMVRLLKIEKALFVLIVSEDYKSAHNLYEQKKEIMTDALEDFLADEVFSGFYVKECNIIRMIGDIIQDA